MKITLNMSQAEIANLLWVLAKSGAESLHGSVVDAIFNRPDEGYMNNTGYGPKTLRYDWSDPDLPGSTLQSCLKSNEKIKAIKILRYNTGIGLLEAKKIVESLM